MQTTKRYILTLDDRDYTLDLIRGAGPWTIVFPDAEPRELDARRVLGGKAWSIRHGNRQHLIHISAAEGRGELTATLDGIPMHLKALDELQALALSETEAAGGGGVLAADIPGLVIDIRVEVGQQVSRGEPIIVVEAMKMQNELAAGITGVVAEIPVATGQAVNPGDTLVIIEPSGD